MTRVLASGLFLSCLAFVACGSDSSGSGSSAPTCESVCPGVLAAQCTGGPADQNDCVSGCEFIRSGSCSAKFQALYACAGASPKYSCDANGSVVVVGCESKSHEMYSCASGGGPPPSGLPPCSDVCTKVIAAQCPSGPPTQAECVTGCETIRTGKCQAQYQSLFDCAGPNPSYTCDAGGLVTVVGCESQDSALNACIATP